MDPVGYPVDVRADYPQRSSRLWAVLTIVFLIKAWALIPHFIVLIFLSIAQFIVALIAQFAVAFRGEYPAGMHEFVTGVLRWQTRVAAFFLSVDDRYPPFTLQPREDHPVDVVAVRPIEPSRMYAVFTIIVEILAIAGGIWFAVWLAGHADSWNSFSSSNSGYRYNTWSYGGSGLLLRQIAAIPHYIVLFFVGIAVFVLWVIVQWVILFVARFPYGMWEIVSGYVRWYTRVNAYALGLIDRYPPFSMRPSMGGPGAQPSAPPPPPPLTATWPQAPQGTPSQTPPVPPPPQTPASQAPPAAEPPAPQAAPQPPAPPPPEPPSQP